MSSSLQICRFSHLHTLTPSDSQTRICSNLLTLISVVRNSQIFSPAVLQKKFFILQTSRPLNLRSSQFHTLSSAASRQKNTPTGTTFSSVAFGQKQNHRSRKPCPNRFKACGLKGERKTCSSAALIQKQACRRKNIFSNAGKNWSEWN